MSKLTLNPDVLFLKDTWMTSSQLEELSKSYYYSWQMQAYTNFIAIIEKVNFPCLFAKSSLKNNRQHFIFLNNLEEKELARLNRIIPLYVKKIRMSRLQKEFIQPLLVIVKPTYNGTLEEHRSQGWEILQYLHEHDSEAWPEDIPKDPTNKYWSFCHSGEQLFVNISSPYHQECHSRNLGQSLILAINPRKNFDKVAPKNTVGFRVRKRIQERSRVYDGRDEATPVAFYGDDNHLEWSMYALPEKKAPLTKTCPFKHKNT
ncbi:YqcI/YcgG family protein [Tenacibaculum amylolyticum]|uniref:YqcI/YcgG family protein n=1 Tax=Tenacibaculum amylolyticum TaxID=104269 RepID=UPI003896201B